MASFEGLRINESDNMRFAFTVYQSEPDKMDAFYLGDLLRAVNINPSLEKLRKLGQPAKQGARFLTVDQCLQMYADLKKELKDFGCYEDFIECLKLYDRNANGMVQLNELQHSLLSLGEKLNDDEIDALFEDCVGEENEDGEIEYAPFLAAMCEVKK